VPPLLVPTVKFGDLCVVDRDEIEQYRSIHQLLRNFIVGKPQRPISLGVFGPPGSGKSFGVKQVAKKVLADENRASKESLEFNLAQFSEPEQLASAFLQVRTAGAGNAIPIVLFDEFDSSLKQQELGWLRYFLAPMQDGEVFYEKQRHTIGPAVLVFAGGTSSSLREFSREAAPDQDRFRFVQAKGPDFVSRLSGSINVLGINRREDVSDQAYVLRRAVIIRATLQEFKLIGRTNRALVDHMFLQSLLEVAKYKHGARSLKTILKMCVGTGGVLQLPPADQLMIHIDKSDAEILLS
jgi:hypothetical protein